MERNVGNNYGAYDEGYGIEVRHEASNRSVAFLQGDDADRLRHDITMAAILEWPRGAVPTFEAALDLILGAYDNLTESEWRDLPGSIASMGAR